MSKADDLFGMLVDTATVKADDDPDLDSRGYPNILSEETDDASRESEDDAAFQGLLDSGLSQEEAQAAVDFMRPLDDEEREILESTPGLDGLYRVDDAERQQWLRNRAKDGSKAMDRVFEDAIYGDTNMNDEERMERNDTDSSKGWGWKSPFRGIKKAVKKAGSLAMSPLKMAMHFIPGRDARKAALVRNTYKKLWYEHANWLAHQDKAAGIPLKPRAQYEYVSKLWAKDQLRKNKLPTSFITGAPFTAGGSPDRTAALQREILGDDGMGSWYWPFGQFLSFARTTVNNTTDKRADAPPEEQQAETAAPGYQDVSAVQAPQEAESYAPPPSYGPPPGYDDSQQGDDMSDMGWNDFIKIKGLGDVLGGEDSLGAYAAQILGSAVKKGIWRNESDPDEFTGQEQPAGPAQPAKDNPHVDQIVKMMVFKLKNGKPISPGELGLLSSAAKEGNTNAQRVLKYLDREGVAIAGDSTGLDPWLYKLSPGYWLRSKTSKEMKDIEEKKWVENAELMKQLKKQQEDLNAAERAAQAAQAVETAKAQAASTDAQLKEIQASLKGGVSGSFVGHEKPTAVSKVVLDAMEKTGSRDAAGRLYAKIKSGQALDKDELRQARKIANLIGRMRVVHGDLISDSDEALTMHGAFIGACAMESIAEALEQNAKYQHLLAGLGDKIAAGKPLAQPERNALAATLKGQKAMHGLVTSMVSGRAFIGCPQKKSWAKGAFIGAAKAMSESDKKMLASIVKLSKLGNPRAQKALAALKQSGEIAGGDFIGLSFSSAFKYATAPVWLPAYGAYRGAKWTGQKLGIVSKGGKGSPEQQRLNMMRAAAKRRQAAEARAAAADAQTAAEQRAQSAIADAADAEADAADAAALAQEEAMKTREVQADPSTLVRDEAEGDVIGKESKKERDAKILAKYSEQSPTGIKLRAGTKLYTQAKQRTPEGRKARLAVKTMIQKANAGDQQAKSDAYAVKAGQLVYRAQKRQARLAAREQRKKAILAIRDARRKKVIALQKGFEARAANKLCRVSRRQELKKHWKAERMAAAGHPKAKAYVAKQVTLASQGDKKAQAHVAAMKQGRQIRQTVTTRREARNVKLAGKFLVRLRRRDPKAVREYMIMDAAAQKKNPNAMRFMARLAIARAIESTVATGTVVMVAQNKRQKAQEKKRQLAAKGSPAHKKAQQQIASARKKAAAGTAKQEELAAAAQTAHDAGDHKTAAEMANLASKAPSASNEINVRVQVLNAAERDHPEAKAALAKDLTEAKKGDPEGIKGLGTTLAAQTMKDVNDGKPVSPTMAEAVNMHERIKAGDPAAIEQAKEITAQAASPSPPPEATLAAAGLVAAAVVDKSLAAKPKAKQEFMEKINPPVPASEKTSAHAEVAAALAKANEGTITAEEGRKASNMALRLGKPRVAAEIIAKSPPWDESPLSSLPDEPLAPITGLLNLLGESAKALLFATRDPLANYKGGIANRGKFVPANPPVASLGWSPSKFFSAAKAAAPFTPFAAPIAAASAIHAAATKKDTPKPAAEAAAPAPAPAPATTAGRAEICGSDEFHELITKALKAKKMSKDDFNKAVKSNLPASADEDTKKASARQTLKFLRSKNVTMEGEFKTVNLTSQEIAHILDLQDGFIKKFNESYSTGNPFRNPLTNLDKAWLYKMAAKEKRTSLDDWAFLLDKYAEPFLEQIDSSLQKLRDKGIPIVGEAPPVKSHGEYAEIDPKAVLFKNLRPDAQLDVLMTKALNDDETFRIVKASKRMRAHIKKRSAENNSDAIRLSDMIKAGAIVNGEFIGADKTFKEHIVAAIKAKKMSKDDFNKAIDAHCGPKASKEAKKTAGEKTLKFLQDRGVKVG